MLTVEDRRGLLLDRLDSFGEDPGELDEHVVGHTEAAEVGEGPEHVDVVGVVGGVAALVGVAEQADLLEPTHEVDGHPGRVDQLVVVVRRALASDEQRLERRRPTVVVEQGLDRGEREPARLERADAFEALEMSRSVPHGAPAALAGRQEPLALVVANRVDRDAGPLRQLVDAPLAHAALRSQGARGVSEPFDLTSNTTE